MRFTSRMSLVMPMAIHAMSTIEGATAACSDGLVNVVFNGPNNSSQFPEKFSKMPVASNWLTFKFGTEPKQIPMLLDNKETVKKAIDVINGPNPPEDLLTFNEPDHDYVTGKVRLTPHNASVLIKPLLESPGKHTKFIAPVPAKQMSSWLDEFFDECQCKDFFAAYNVHIYRGNVKDAKDEIKTFHDKFNDKPLWITEIGPGNKTLPCPNPPSWDKTTKFMKEIYAWGQSTEWIHKIFWNTGNQITSHVDNNVCNSYLLDGKNNPTPLLDPFNHLTCS